MTNCVVTDAQYTWFQYLEAINEREKEMQF